MSEDNVVYIGNKKPMSYVLAVVTQFQSGAKEVLLKARGRSVSRAVDVAEIVKNRFIPDVKESNIEISTEQIPAEEGKMINVSAITITLAKP